MCPLPPMTTTLITAPLVRPARWAPRAASRTCSSRRPSLAPVNAMSTAGARSTPDLPGGHGRGAGTCPPPRPVVSRQDRRAAAVDHEVGAGHAGRLVARTRRHPSRAERRPDPAPHERYLWDAGFHWEEWLVPGDDSAKDLGALARLDQASSPRRSTPAAPPSWRGSPPCSAAPTTPRCGTRAVVASDGSWRSTLGPETRADIDKGETVDFRRELPGWSSTGFDDGDWTPVEVGTLDPARLVAPTGPPVRRTQTVPVREITTSRPGRRWSTSARTSSAACASRCRTPPRAPRSPSGTRRSSRTASSGSARCGSRTRRTSSCSTAPAPGPGSRASRSTGSATPRSPAGQAR